MPVVLSNKVAGAAKPRDACHCQAHCQAWPLYLCSLNCPQKEHAKLTKFGGKLQNAKKMSESEYNSGS